MDGQSLLFSVIHQQQVTKNKGDWISELQSCACFHMSLLLNCLTSDRLKIVPTQQGKSWSRKVGVIRNQWRSTMFTLLFELFFALGRIRCILFYSGRWRLLTCVYDARREDNSLQIGDETLSWGHVTGLKVRQLWLHCHEWWHFETKHAL